MTLASKENFPLYSKTVQILIGFMLEVKPLHKPRGDLVLCALNHTPTITNTPHSTTPTFKTHPQSTTHPPSSHFIYNSVISLLTICCYLHKIEMESSHCSVWKAYITMFFDSSSLNVLAGILVVANFEIFCHLLYKIDPIMNSNSR